MTISVYVENQIHDRTYAGVLAGESLTRILDECSPGADELLGGIHPYGDTMLNAIQLQRFCLELEAAARSHGTLSQDVERLKELAQSAIRQRGYLWLSGD